MGRFGPRGGRARQAANERQTSRQPIVYYVFDLLYLDGRPAARRAARAAQAAAAQRAARARPRSASATHVRRRQDFYEAVGEQGLEGMIAKLRTSRYEPGQRSQRVAQDQDPARAGGGRRRLRAGQGRARRRSAHSSSAVHEDGELRYVGEVGSGLDRRTIRQLKTRARRARPRGGAGRRRAAHQGRAVVGAAPRRARRVQPSGRATATCARRHYKGLEIGKDPESVVRERPTTTKTAVGEAELRPVRAHTLRRVLPPNPRPGDRTSAGDAGRARRSEAPPARSDEGAERSTGDRAAGPAEGDRLPQAATADELAALEAISKEGHVGDRRPDRQPDQPRQGAVPRAGLHQARPDPLLRDGRAGACCPTCAIAPLNLSRWPDGVNGHTFWQKQIPHWAPEWIARWDYPEAGSNESHTYLVADQVATMAWLANHATSTCTHGRRAPDAIAARPMP